MDLTNPLAVFVKPWKTLPLPKLGAHVRQLGLEWIELPVRPGFPCQPETIERDLPQAVHVLGEEGIRILNVAVDLPLDDERLYAACAKANIDLNRIMFRTGKRNYWEAEKDARRQLDTALPLCERYGVRLGIQNHSNDFVGVHELGLYHLLKDYDHRYIGAIWDPAHNSLEGMAPEAALDVVAEMLYIVNLKNGYWRLVSPPEAEVAEWKIYWTSGRHGRTSWERVLTKLKQMNYTGPLCFTAEYSDEHSVDRLIAEDVTFAKSLLASIAEQV